MHLTILLFHPRVPCSKLIKKKAHIMVQRCQKCYRGKYFNGVMYIALLLSHHIIDNGNFCYIAFLNILLFITVNLKKI